MLHKGMDRIEKLKEFLRKEPHDSFTRHALAMEYMALGDDGAARALLEALLTDDPMAVGSYYQLGKLLERAGETNGALQCYERGMMAAREAGERRTLNELTAAYNDLADE